MDRPSLETADAARELLEELLHTGLTVTDLLAALLDETQGAETPEDGEAMIDLVVGICRPALTAEKVDACLAAATLIHAVREQILEALCDPP